MKMIQRINAIPIAKQAQSQTHIRFARSRATRLS